MDDSVTNWTDLQEFKGVDLTSSFVLSWRYGTEMLELDIDVCLTPRHPLYETPRRANTGCILPAVIEFPFCERLVASGRSAVGDAIKSLGSSLGHGRIKNLQRIAEGEYRIDGEFGSMVIHSERPLLRLRGRTT